MSDTILKELRAAADALLADVFDEIEQRKNSGNDEYWQGLDNRALRLRKAVDAVAPANDQCPVASLWDAASDAVEDPDSGLADNHRQALVTALEGMARREHARP